MVVPHPKATLGYGEAAAHGIGTLSDPSLKAMASSRRLEDDQDNMACGCVI
jgi:hypothetical protein